MNKPVERVSDTALWVAVYRARESLRRDRLFNDPFAARLAGEKGQAIAHAVRRARMMQWSLTIRTASMDDMLLKILREENIELVINLGAGLDTRPYRLDLPAQLKWVEIDFQHMLDYKIPLLAKETPRCDLRRFAVDLSIDAERKKILAELTQDSKRTLFITEGVVPYLPEPIVNDLQNDLKNCAGDIFWLQDIYSPMIVKSARKSMAKNVSQTVSFQFDPPSWVEFFTDRAWKIRDERYTWDEAERLGRPIPYAWFFKILSKIGPKAEMEKNRKMAGYLLLQKP